MQQIKMRTTFQVTKRPRLKCPSWRKSAKSQTGQWPNHSGCRNAGWVRIAAYWRPRDVTAETVRSPHLQIVHQFLQLAALWAAEQSCQSLRIGTKTRGELAPEDMRTHKFFWFTFGLCMPCKSSREGRIGSSGDAGSFGGEHSTSNVVCSASHQKHKALKKQKRKQRLKTEKPKANKEEPKENKRELRNQRQTNRNQD